MKVYYSLRYNKAVGDMVMSRALLEQVLYGYLGLPETAVIMTEEQGRRFVDSRYGIGFSVTHTQNLWMCSAAPYRNGIDAEMASRNIANPLNLAARFMTPEECEYVRTGGSLAEKKERFVYAWTRKEACLKYTGEGLHGLREAPCVTGSVEGVDLRTYRRNGALVSICAGRGKTDGDPEFVCMDPPRKRRPG